MAKQFESSVISYGSEANQFPSIWSIRFESSVISYGSEAENMKLLAYLKVWE